MINFYNYLTDKKVSQSLYEMLFAKFMQNEEPPTYTEYEGALPITITANGDNLADWLIYGNTVTSGTPSPSDPVTIEGVGDFVTTGEHTGQYEILMKSNTTSVTPMYVSEPLMKIGTYYDTLDAVGMTTRQIKKLVLKGDDTETWSMSDSTFGKRYSMTVSGARQSDTSQVTTYCTHLPLGVAGATYSQTDTYTITTASVLYVSRDSTFTSIADFKAWLSDQYTNGTPVTIYYVLATPTTGAITASPIPTNNGSTVISCDNTVQPEKMYIKYIGG